jgi:hypothetical protein
MEPVSLLLGISALFPACVQGYRALASIQGFRKEASALYWKLTTQELRFITWGEAYGFKPEEFGDRAGQLAPTATNTNHSLTVLQLTHCVLSAMRETLSDVDKLNSRYGLHALGSAPQISAKSPQISLLRFRWVLHDKIAFERLIEDLKDFNDGLHATLVPLVQRNVECNVCSQVSDAAHQVDELRTIQAISPEFEMLQNTVSFKAFNIEVHQHNAIDDLRLSTPEIPSSALSFLDNNNTASRNVRSQAYCRMHSTGLPQAVLVEWKYYEQNLEVKVSLDQSLHRINRLVRLLGQKPKPKDFRTLDCIGYVHDRFHARVGLVFALDHVDFISSLSRVQVKDLTTWISLYDLIEKQPKLPLLGHRVDLALALLRSMIQLHSTGWLHKGFQSSSILFLSPANSKDNEGHPSLPPVTESLGLSVDIRDPKVMGFEFSRPSSKAEFSDDIRGGSLGCHEAYMHPGYLKSALAHVDMESSDVNRFKHEYDMYSLGCVLLEIGLWRRLTDLWKTEYTCRDETFWAKRLCQKYVPELGGRCGEMYQRVVQDLLSYGHLPSREAHPQMTNFELLQALGNIRT